MRVQTKSRLAALSAAVLATSGILVATVPDQAVARQHPVLKNVIPQSAEVSVRGRIASIDPNSRSVTLDTVSGAKVTVTAGPAVHLDRIKVGDSVNVQYYRSVAFDVIPPSGGAGVPGPGANEMAELLARPVEAPGGIGMRVTKVSGTIVGIDLDSHTLDMINPSGGGVYTVKVTDPERIAKLPKLRVGDTITAVISQAFAISIEPSAM